MADPSRCVLTGERRLARGEPRDPTVPRFVRGRGGAVHDNPGFATALSNARHALEDEGYYVLAPLGCGAYGCAYGAQDPEGNRVVVKFTSDASEAAAAARVLEAVEAEETSWERLPGLVRFHCVYSFTETPLYAIVQERLETLPDEARRFSELPLRKPKRNAGAMKRRLKPSRLYRDVSQAEEVGPWTHKRSRASSSAQGQGEPHWLEN